MSTNYRTIRHGGRGRGRPGGNDRGANTYTLERIERMVGLGLQGSRLFKIVNTSLLYST